jgi:AraC-like DNA-binding protein
LVDDHGSLAIGRLQIESGDVLTDATLGSLAAALIPAFLRPHEANTLFIEHVARAGGCYVAQRFGTLRERQHRRGGLAAWQESRAKQIIDHRLAGDVSLELLASECGLSTSHFIRAFRNSVGLSPHQWLMRRRIDKALSLMHDHSLSLSQIALACGFADQSHFTRAFTAALGESPGAYRRTNGVATTPRPHF